MPTAQELDLKRCKHCRKVFTPSHSYNRFCSVRCGAAGRSNKKPVPCATCGKRVLRNAYQIAHSPRFFCSWKCKNIYQSRQFAGVKNPNFKNAGLKTCERCKKVFKHYDRQRRFCSQKCSWMAGGTKLCAGLRKGTMAEKELLRMLKLQGYHVTRSSGSRGIFDLVAINETEILLIQVKASGSKYHLFPKRDRVRLAEFKVANVLSVKKQMMARLDGGVWQTITL